MPTKDPIIVLGLTGAVDTISARTEVLEKAGLNHIRYAEATAAMSAADKHNALVDLAIEIRRGQPNARFIVFEESVRPLAGARPMVEGSISYGAMGPQTIAAVKQAIADVRAFEITAAPTIKPAAKPAHPPLDTGPDETPAASDRSFPHWSPFVAAKQAKKPAEPKPKLLVLYYQPCNGAGIVSNPKAEITHAMVVPKDLQHAEFLTEDALPKLDRKKLGVEQSRKHGKPAFLKAMAAHFGESFWSNKKFDTALSSADELQKIVRAGGYDGVVVVGSADRQQYALLPENVEKIVHDMALEKSPCMRLATGSDDLVNATREAIGDVIADGKKAAATAQEPAEIVKRALEKAAQDEAPQQRIALRPRRVSQAPASRALQPTRPITSRRETKPHVLVLYAPDMADEKINQAGADVDMDRALLVAREQTGDFVNPDGAIQRSALASRPTPPAFISDARARFGEGFHRSVKAVLSTPDQLTTYLGKRHSQRSLPEIRAYDEVVLVGTLPEGFSLTREQIEEACNAHKSNGEGACTFTQLEGIEALRARFPLKTVEQSLGLAG